MTKAPRRKPVTRKTPEPSKSSRVVLSSVMRYDNPGQLTVPNHLNLGDDGKLYLTRSSEMEDAKAKSQAISLKESVAWFRLGHDYA